MGYLWIRWGLGLVVILMVAFIGFRVVTYMQERAGKQNLTQVIQNPPDAWINDFTYRQTHSGVAKWKVVAKRAKVFESTPRFRAAVMESCLFASVV